MSALFDHTMIKMGIENREGFDNLFRHYYPRLKSYVSSFVEDSVAEDITQDVFLYVWENRKRYSWIQNCYDSRYLRTITCSRKLRRKILERS
ncbi:MAG: sigma factor [Macellibacteroides sp.]|uniref:sigma factor n=1 Tax=Macellibacteroides sp. TaxID=2014584 RepID=UPI003E73CB39